MIRSWSQRNESVPFLQVGIGKVQVSNGNEDNEFNIYKKAKYTRLYDSEKNILNEKTMIVSKWYSTLIRVLVVEERNRPKQQTSCVSKV